MASYFGIDPGSTSGAVAIIGDDHQPIYWMCKNETTRDIYEGLGDFYEIRGGIVEDVGPARPGQGLASQSKLILHAGEMRAIASCLGLPWELMTAKKWRAMLGLAQAKARPQRKKLNKELAQRLYPNEKLTNDKVDALLLAHLAKKVFQPKKTK